MLTRLAQTMPAPFEHLRIQYGDQALSADALPADPLALFRTWFAAAEAAGTSEPNGMALATVDATGAPACRIVLLKGLDEQGFHFFTNYESDKGRQLARDPRAALTFWWNQPCARQVRVCGDVQRTDPAAADAYFASRPRSSQVASAISPQSQPIADRAMLEQRAAELQAQVGDGPIARPPHWGGYVVAARQIEFWQGRDHRLHDRFRYVRIGHGWTRERLAP